MEETGLRIEDPSAVRLRNLIREGSWLHALDVVEHMRTAKKADNCLSERVFTHTRVLLIEERVKELLGKRDVSPCFAPLVHATCV